MSGVRLLCGEVPDLPLPEGLPSNLIFETLTEIEAELLRDLDLGTANRRIGKIETDLTTDQEDFLVPTADFHAPSYVYLQIDPSSPSNWRSVEIVEHSSIERARQTENLAIAFSGSPPRGYFSWLPDSHQVLRVWYERDMDEPTLVDSTDLGGLYDQYLKLLAAAQCREYLKLEIGVVFKQRLIKSERQWQKFVNRGNQRGLGSKAPAYRRRGYRSYPYIDTRRLTVS